MVSRRHRHVLIYSRDCRFIVLHPSKTAGHSIRQALQAVVPDLTGVGDPNEPHLTPDQAKDCVPDWDEFIKVTVARNPYDRMVSLYSWLVKGAVPFQYWLNHSSRNTERGIAFSHPLVRYTRHADIILRFEDLRMEFSRFCDRVLQRQVALPRVNASEHRPYQDYYDDRTRAIVQQRYADDLADLGYGF